MSTDSRTIRVVNAGAGSGKTYRITEEIFRAVIEEKIEPSRIIATTFTRRAATELRSRVVGRLTAEGRLTEARSLGSALIGTVHSVCGRLLRRYCYEAGISPELNVLSEAESKFLISQVIGEAATSHNILQIGRLSTAFGYNEISRTGGFKHDWHDDVRDIISFARSNNLTAKEITEHAELSTEEIVGMLPAADIEYRVFQDTLAEEIEKAISLIPPDDTTIATNNAKQLLSRLLNRMEHGRTISWKDIDKLCSLDTGAKSRDVVEVLRSKASEYVRTYEYHRNIADYIRTVSKVAANTLNLFEIRKRETGVMDFVDQEAGFLDALENRAFQARLREEFSLLVVDEFQDTNPVQLAIFMKIAELGIRTVWVGDMRQSIYAFRDADPELMNAVIKALPDAYRGDILKYSYRSRPSLVTFTNALFSSTFETVMTGVPVSLKPKREELTPGDAAVHFWSFPYDRDFKKNDDYHTAVAAGIQDLVDNKLQVAEETSTERAVRYGDIAVLCRTRGHAQSISNALSSANIPVIMERPGLLATPEGVFLSAALRYLADSSDTLAVAEMRMLSDAEIDVASLVSERIEFVNNDNKESWSNDNEIIAAIDDLRTTLHEASIYSIVDAILARLNITRVIGRFGNSKRVYGNLERIRSLVDEYTQSASRNSLGSSLAGFIHFLEQFADEQTDIQSVSMGVNAVNVLTYHGAKGLEWPVVVCMELDKSFDARPFTIEMRERNSVFSPYEPLAGRSIRFWPDPGTGSNSFLISQIESSSIYEKRKMAEFAESCRLLYVGFTRARDYLILPFQRKANGKQKLSWLEAVYSAGRERILEVPDTDGEYNELFDTGTHIPAKVVCKSCSDRAKVQNREEQISVVTKNRGATEFSPYRVVASGASIESEYRESDYKEAGSAKAAREHVGWVFEYAKPIEITSAEDPAAFGEAVHAILLLTVDRNSVPEKAEIYTILSHFGVNEWSGSQVLIQRSGEFLEWLSNTWPGASYDLETSGYTKEHDRLMTARIDMLVDTYSEIVIIDHKTHVDTIDVEEVALDYVSQLAMYRRVVEKAKSRKQIRTMVHLPVQGKVIEIHT